jgi:hypothetical protein
MSLLVDWGWQIRRLTKRDRQKAKDEFLPKRDEIVKSRFHHVFGISGLVFGFKYQ